MKITKLEQSGFIFEAKNGHKLGIDIGRLTPLENITKGMVDSLLISHLHGDHFSEDHIKKINPEKLFLNQECISLIGNIVSKSKIVQIKSSDRVYVEKIKVSAFEVDHGPNTKIVPKENFGFLIDIDGEKVYFGGDIFYPTGLDVSKLDVDYALIPVGGFYTFGPKEAVSFAKKFKKIGKVVPMHYEKVTETRDQFKEIAIASSLNVAIL